MVQHVGKRVATVRTQNTWWIDGGPRFPMGRMLEMRKREVGGKANYIKVLPLLFNIHNYTNRPSALSGGTLYTPDRTNVRVAAYLYLF